MKHARNILAVGAHADDVEINCGGTVAKHVEEGDNVILLVMAESSYSSYDGSILRSRDEAISEGKRGADILGAKLINLGFKNKDVPYSSESVEAINRIIDDYDIDTIYTHWSYDSHQDHMRTTQSVISAARYVSNILMYEPEYPAGRSYVGFRNQYYVNITSTFDKKIKAIRQHESQVKKYGEDIFINALKAKAIHRGYEVQCSYAECFEVLRLMGDFE
ncbi:PIG-L deacetylase family protein [Methanococcoides sp. NM1]|uniref:PIG-L deacetylase family protein n=1 Tax=Methanococcoides sp. NM1 TaxID=1201013 RepID=UPI001438436C|nr:PIG-L family deacetylase [Methanococcoides sp. NM1]